MIDLHEMRHHPALKWAMYIAFGVIIVSFVFFYGWQPNKENKPTVFAKIKGAGGWHEITPREMQEASQQAIAAKQQMLPSESRNLPPSVAERLVTTPEIAQTAADEIIVKQQAKKLGVEFSREDVINVLRQQPGITDEMVRAQAQKMGLTLNGFLEYLRDGQEQMIVRQLQTMAVSASLYEVWQEYVLANEKLKLELAAFPVDSYTTQVTVTENDLQQYLDKHKDTFKIPDQRRYAFAKVDKFTLRENLKPTSATLLAYYDQHKDKFLEKAAFRTAEIVAPLSADRSTTEIVNALHAARTTATTAADWQPLTEELRKQHPKLSFYNRTSGWLTGEDTQQRSQLFLSRAAALTSDTVTTTIVDKENVYLIKVIERRREGTPPYDKIMSKVEDTWREDEAQKQFDAAATRWQEAADQHKSVAEFAKALGVKDELTTRIERTNPVIPGFTALYRDRAYLESLPVNEMSSLIKTDNVIGVLQVVEEIPAYDPPLNEVHAKVEKALRAERARDVAKAAAEQSLNLIKTGAPFNQTLATAPKPAYLSELFSRRDPVSGLGQPLQQFTTQTLALTTGTTGLSPYGPAGGDAQGYAVWKVAEMRQPTREQFAIDRERYVQEYIQLQRMAVLREWLADARKQAQFEIVNNK